MPVPIIWKLEIPRGRRVGICGVFFLGGIVLVASIVRLAYLQNLSKYDSTCKFSFGRSVSKQDEHELISDRRHGRYLYLVRSGAQCGNYLRLPSLDGPSLPQGQGLVMEKVPQRRRPRSLESHAHRRTSRTMASVAGVLVQIVQGICAIVGSVQLGYLVDQPPAMGRVARAS